MMGPGPRRVFAARFAFCALALGCAANAAPLGQGHEVAIPWFRLIAGLGLCIVLAYAGALILRQSQSGTRLSGMPGTLLKDLPRIWSKGLTSASEPLPMKVVQTLHLGNRVELVLLELDGRRMLVATSPTGPAVLLAPEVEPE